MSNNLSTDYQTKVQKAEEIYKKLYSDFEIMKKDIQKALPDGMDADRMLVMMITALQKNPSLLECEHSSLFGAFIQTAYLGLNMILGECSIVPYYDKNIRGKVAQFQIDAKGFVELSYRSGAIWMIEPVVVYCDDVFKIIKGTDPQIIHEPQYKNNEDEDIIGAYAVAYFENNKTSFEYMKREAIEKIRLLAPSQKIQIDGGWVPAKKPIKIWKDFFPEMCKKTVIKRLGKYLPKNKMGDKLIKAFQSDDGIFRVEKFSGAGYLPENIEKPDYTKEAIPLVDTETGEITELKQQQVNTQSSMLENQAVKMERPYSPDQMRKRIEIYENHVKKNKIKIKPISELMPKYQVSMSSLLLSKDELKAIREYLFNVESSNNLNATQMQFIIKWIDSQKEETEDGEIWLPNAFAQKEANLILDLKTEEIAGDF